MSLKRSEHVPRRGAGVSHPWRAWFNDGPRVAAVVSCANAKARDHDGWGKRQGGAQATRVRITLRSPCSPVKPISASQAQIGERPPALAHPERASRARWSMGAGQTTAGPTTRSRARRHRAPFGPGRPSSGVRAAPRRR